MFIWVKKIKPQIMAAILCLTLIAALIVLVAPTFIEVIVGSIVTGIGMLAMKVVEDSKDE